MDENGGEYGDQLVACASAATGLLQALPAEVFRLGGDQLGAVLGMLDRLGALCDAARYTISREAQLRGEVGSSQAGYARAWIAQHCPSLDDAGAGQVAKAVRELETPDLTPVRTAVSDGSVSVPAGCVIAAEWRAIRPLLADGAETPVLDGYVSIAGSHGRAGVRALRPALLARYGLGDQLQREQDRRAYLTSLSAGADLGGGLTEYRLRLNPDGRAALEAAIGPLSAPVPGDDGLIDGRTPDRRRGDALVEACRRATAAANANTPSGVKATVFVTIGLDDLQGRVSALGLPLGDPESVESTGTARPGWPVRRGDRSLPGVLLGGLDAGTVLGPDTVRKLACDAQLIPTVLGSNGEILDLGRTHRLFTRGQIHALALRDHRCTWPGCDIPAHWCDAHHLLWWQHGGTSTLDNAALLCGRHHTIAHRDHLAGRLDLTTGHVTWNAIPHSYERALARSQLARSDPADEDYEGNGGGDGKPDAA